jgi:epsilon-lactone hydrolase
MSIFDARALHRAGKLFKKAVYNPKTPIKTIRANYDSVLGTVTIPNNVDRREVDLGPIMADFLVPRLAIGKRTTLYAPGGGFVAGPRFASRNLCASIAHESASRLLPPEYRLAPEYPFPTAIEDLYTAYTWLLREGYQSGDIILAGDGAGANLALALVHLLAERNVRRPAAIVTLSPWIDLACDSASFNQRKSPDPIHTRETLVALAQQYAQNESLSDPKISPIHGDYALWPHLYVQCGTEEVLIDDARRLARKAENSGIPVTLDVEEGMWHLFQAVDSLTPRAHLAIKRIGAWVRAESYGGSEAGISPERD